MYQRDENSVLLNPRHDNYQEAVERICADAGPDAERCALASRLFNEEYCFSAGTFVIQGWLFKGKAHWSDCEWEEALNMGALTLHLVNPGPLAEARRRYRQKLNTRKTAAIGEKR